MHINGNDLFTRITTELKLKEIWFFGLKRVKNESRKGKQSKATFVAEINRTSFKRCKIPLCCKLSTA